MSASNISTIKRSASLRFDTGRLRRNIQKHINRTKEKVMHNLDKVERTDDDFIKRSEAVLLKKQASTVKLQTELKRHLKALRNVSASSRSLHETMLEAYEDNWAGRKEFSDALVNLDSCWLHYFSTLVTVIEQVGNHVDEFVNMKEKLDKRKRKLVDYNLAKRNLQQATSAKKRDESKVKKVRREVEFVENAYCELNADLRRDLPVFYDSHVHFCCENWSYLLENEKSMHENICSSVQVFISSLNQLRIGYQKSQYQLSCAELSFSEISRSSVSLAFDSVYSNGDVYESLDDGRHRQASATARPQLTGAFGGQRHGGSLSSKTFPADNPAVRSQSAENITSPEDEDYGTLGEFASSPSTSANFRRSPRDRAARPVEREESVYNADHHVYALPDRAKKERWLRSATAPTHSSLPRAAAPVEDVYNEVNIAASSASSSLSSRPQSAPRSTASSSPRPEKARRPDNLPMMIAIHPYVSQDEDELTLAINDIIQVLPWENESLKEDGWLFGMMLPDGKKGLFPENHTNMLAT